MSAELKTACAILNLGRIAASTLGVAGIELQAGGTITNGTTGDTTALIAGADASSNGGVGGTGISLSGGSGITNAGTIVGGSAGTEVSATLVALAAPGSPCWAAAASPTPA